MFKLLSYRTLAYRPEIKCEKQYYDNKVHYVAGAEYATKYVDKHSCNLQSQEAGSIISSAVARLVQWGVVIPSRTNGKMQSSDVRRLASHLRPAVVAEAF